MDWNRPPLQPRSVEILRSIEHNRLPAVVGTSTPPRGLSGAVKRGVPSGVSQDRPGRVTNTGMTEDFSQRSQMDAGGEVPVHVRGLWLETG